jgi:PAS domain-containing protein
MSLCFLRSSSPIHVQYLKNMGVAATLVVSLMVGGRLWGLVSCHHYAPRTLQFEMRAMCELLAEVIGTRIAALESFLQGQSELSVRRLEQRMVEAIAREGDWRGALFDSAQSLLLPLGASGAALLYEGQALTVGDAPGTEEIRAIGKWIEGKKPNGVFATSSLGLEEPSFASLAGVASGVVAAPVSGEAGEMLIWFRNERVRTVTWGGDPFKPPSLGDDPSELSPRRSFAQWHQVVEKTSDPWTAADLAAAKMIGAIVSDVILQFRTVRILIAQDQLEQMSKQVRSSGQQVVIANADGRIIETNAAFDSLVVHDAAKIEHLDDLPGLFVDSDDLARRLNGMRASRRAWRGEVGFKNASGEIKPLLLRAEPVIAGRGRVLGFVLVFSDLSEKSAAEAARRRFQESIVQSHRKLMGRIDSQADLTLEKLMSDVIENAQLAALEIADGPDTARMPQMLEGVRNSVARAAEVLEQISIAPDRMSTRK